MRYKNVGTSFFNFVRMHTFDRQTDGQTDGQTDRKALAIPCVALHACSRTVKIIENWQELTHPYLINDI